MTDLAPDEQPKPVRAETLETEDGVEVPSQQNVGPGNRQGSGEWPSPSESPPQEPAPGAADAAEPEGRPEG
ncbi:MAG TPA: hypothetical protein VHF00_02265 [Acidimicrobiales bacterium]|jgi:hypothetical protein|nr:hypothetical protein [Acidimicrobiales bacterium]